MNEPEPTIETQTPSHRNFVIPGADVIIQCSESEPMAVSQLLSIVFQLAAANPAAHVDFWIKVKGN